MVADKDKAEKYITSALTNEVLVMYNATQELKWTFPRIRSKAETICKRLGGRLRRKSRGVYYFAPFRDDVKVEIPTKSNNNSTSVTKDKENLSENDVQKLLFPGSTS